MSVVGLGLGITASANFEVAAEAEVIRKKVGVIAAGNAQVDTAQSKFGGASALFDGTNDKLTAKTSEIQWGTLTTWTIEFWMRWASTGVIDSVVGTRSLTNTVSPGEFQFVTLTSNKLQLNVRNTSGTNMTALVSGNTISQNTWHHIAIVRDGNTYELFLDGTSEGSQTLSGDLSDKDIFFGEFAENLDYNGHIDEFRFSNTARYTTGFTPTTEPFQNDDNTKLLLHMNGTDGSTFFEDDNTTGRSSVGVSALGNAQVDTAQSKFGGASYLGDGTGDGLSTTGIYEIGTGDFTIECFARLDNVGVNQMFFDCRPTSTNGAYPGFFFLGSTNKPYYYFNTATRITADSTLSTNTWYHLAVVRSSGVTTMYIDGTAQSTTYSNSDSISFTDAHIGVSNDPTPGQSVDGFLDEVRISNTARYTAAFTAPTAPFVNDDNTLLLLHMDGTDASTDFRDDNGDHTTGRTGVLVSASGNAQIDTAQSKYGGASALFDGTADHLVSKGATWVNHAANDFTHECWFKTSSSTIQTLFAKRSGSGASNTDFVSYVWDTGKIRLYLSDGSSYFVNAYETTGTYDDGNWHHVAFVRNGERVDIYVDGTSDAGAGGNTESIPDSSKNFYIGEQQGDGSAPFNGHIDEVRISNIARYTTSFTAPTAPFVDDTNTLLLLHMDGADGSTSFVDDVGGRSSVGVSAIGNAQIDTAEYKFGGASVYFDGNDDRLQIENEDSHITLNRDYWTVEGWFRIESHIGSYNIALGIWGATNKAFYFSTNIFDTTNKMGMDYFDINGVNSGPIEFGSALSTGTWIHLAWVNNNGTVTAYQNGTSVGTHTLSDRIRDFAIEPFVIGGRSNNAGEYQGWMDEIRISNTARYTTGFTAPTEPFQNDANTLLLLHMDGTDGSTVFIDDNGKQA